MCGVISSIEGGGRVRGGGGGGSVDGLDVMGSVDTAGGVVLEALDAFLGTLLISK